MKKKDQMSDHVEIGVRSYKKKLRKKKAKVQYFYESITFAFPSAVFSLLVPFASVFASAAEAPAGVSGAASGFYKINIMSLDDVITMTSSTQNA